MATAFDAPTLDMLDRAMEVEIETLRPDGMPRMTTIWLIVDDGEVFVRSWRGDRGYWYQGALDSPGDVTLHVAGRTIPVRVVQATDETSINRCSIALERKYAGDPATPSMVRPGVLGMTLRLEPR
jgi:hypothetical protein